MQLVPDSRHSSSLSFLSCDSGVPWMREMALRRSGVIEVKLRRTICPSLGLGWVRVIADGETI